MNKKKIVRVPIFGDLLMSFSRTIIGILLGLVFSGILIAISGVNPFVAYSSMIRGCFASTQAFSNVLVRSSPLLLGGMGVAIGIKSGVWNTGIEGYMYLGAIGATFVAIPNLKLPTFFHIILALLAAILVAAIWGSIPGFLKAYKNVNEVTSTIMMNYIAIYLTSWLVSDFKPIADIGAFYPMSKKFQSTAILPVLMRGTSLHPGFIIGLATCFLFSFLLKKTPFGFRTRMLGGNPFAATYAGVNTRKQIFSVIIIGAILGGMSGAIEVMGLKNRLYMDFVTGIGYECVAVALVAGGNPIGVLLSSLFFACLKVGGATMSIETGLSSSMNSIIIALCVLFVIAVGVEENYRVNKRIKSKNKGD